MVTFSFPHLWRVLGNNWKNPFSKNKKANSFRKASSPPSSPHLCHLLVILRSFPTKTRTSSSVFPTSVQQGRVWGRWRVAFHMWLDSRRPICRPPYYVSGVWEPKKTASFFPYPRLATPDTLGKDAGADGTFFYREGLLCHLDPRAKAKARLKKILFRCLLMSLSSPAPPCYKSYSCCSLIIQIFSSGTSPSSPFFRGSQLGGFYVATRGDLRDHLDSGV